MTSLIRHVAFFSLKSLEPCSGRLESIREEPLQLYTCLLCLGSAVGVSHSSCVASLLPAAVAGWCLRCLRVGLCPRYSSTWLWVSSPLFTLTGCAGYWPGKSGQDGLSCKEEGGLVMYRLLLGPFMGLLLETPCNPSLYSSCALSLSLIPLSISVPQSSRRSHPI